MKSNSRPVMRFCLNGKVYYIVPKPGSDGLSEFKNTVRKLCNLSEDTQLDLSFQCSDPVEGVFSCNLWGFLSPPNAAHAKILLRRLTRLATPQLPLCLCALVLTSSPEAPFHCNVVATHHVYDIHLFTMCGSQATSSTWRATVHMMQLCIVQRSGLRHVAVMMFLTTSSTLLTHHRSMDYLGHLEGRGLPAGLLAASCGGIHQASLMRLQPRHPSDEFVSQACSGYSPRRFQSLHGLCADHPVSQMSCTAIAVPMPTHLLVDFDHCIHDYDLHWQAY